MGTTTERSFSPDELKEQSTVSRRTQLTQTATSVSQSPLLYGAILAGAFALFQVHLEYALGAFLLVSGAKLLPIVIQVKGK